MNSNPKALISSAAEIEAAFQKAKDKLPRFPDTVALGGIVPPAKGNHGWRADKGESQNNTSGFSATGHRVLLLGPQVETQTKSGIALVLKTAEAERSLSVRAVVVEIGHDAWSDKSTDYCEVGDTVLIGQYTGLFIKSEADGKEYRFLNDLDIIARITKAN